jgi:anti-sigma regulatory factor (Ser/Thr protein kinase)/serine/threonine protein phosphatase PrpC
MNADRETIALGHSSDVLVCRRRVAHLATGMGFPAVQVGELAIVATELAENVLRHGGGRGEFSLSKIVGPRGQGIEIVCTDSGPGFDPAAFADGFSTAGSLGIGLGAVRRFADSCEVQAVVPGRGARVIVRKWLPVAPASAPAVPWPRGETQFEVGACSRPVPGYHVNGDAYAVRFLSAGRARVAVIDGLGHGVEAHEAAVQARNLVETRTELDLLTLFRELDERLRRTRGAVAAAADIDLSAARLAFVGVGNIEAVLLGAENSQPLISTSGILGNRARTPRRFEYDWSPASMLVLCSDGIRNAWRTSVDKKLLAGHPDVLANVIINSFTREADDATVLGIRQRRP